MLWTRSTRRDEGKRRKRRPLSPGVQTLLTSTRGPLSPLPHARLRLTALAIREWTTVRVQELELTPVTTLKRPKKTLTKARTKDIGHVRNVGHVHGTQT